MTSPTLFDVAIVEKLTPIEIQKLQNHIITEVPTKATITGGFFKESEAISWVKSMWTQLVDLQGILGASNYLIKVWKRVDNVGNCKCVYAGDLSNFVFFEEDTLDSLFNDWDYYVEEDEDDEGEESWQ